MAPETVYIKTALGRAEIQRRGRGLAPRLRQVLILVDGKRSVAEIGVSLGGVEDIGRLMAALEQAGCIEAEPSEQRPLADEQQENLEFVKRLLADRIHADLGAGGGTLIQGLADCRTPGQLRSHMSEVYAQYERSVGAKPARTLRSLVQRQMGPETPGH